MIDSSGRLVDLDGAKLLEVKRMGDMIQIMLDAVSISSTDTAGQKRHPRRGRVKMVLRNVSAERADYFIGEGVTAPHPDPTFPLDTIEVAEYSDNVLTLQGYRKGEPWYVWEIDTPNVAVEAGDSQSAPSPSKR